MKHLNYLKRFGPTRVTRFVCSRYQKNGANCLLPSDSRDDNAKILEVVLLLFWTAGIHIEHRGKAPKEL